MPISTPQSFSCPLCGQVDMVQKVSSLVEGGTVAGIYSNTAGAQISAVTQSTKATQLAPPSQPILVSPWGCGSYFLVAVGLFFGIIFVIGGIAVIVQPSLANNNILFGLIVDWGIGAIIFAIVIAIFNSKAKTAARRKAQYETDKVQYKHAKAIWDELYYCARNDVVFRPGNRGACVPASQMARLLT